MKACSWEPGGGGAGGQAERALRQAPRGTRRRHREVVPLKDLKNGGQSSIGREPGPPEQAQSPWRSGRPRRRGRAHCWRGSASSTSSSPRPADQGRAGPRIPRRTIQNRSRARRSRSTMTSRRGPPTSPRALRRQAARPADQGAAVAARHGLRRDLLGEEGLTRSLPSLRRRQSRVRPVGTRRRRAPPRHGGHGPGVGSARAGRTAGEHQAWACAPRRRRPPPPRVPRGRRRRADPVTLSPDKRPLQEPAAPRRRSRRAEARSCSPPTRLFGKVSEAEGLGGGSATSPARCSQAELVEEGPARRRFRPSRPAESCLRAPRRLGPCGPDAAAHAPNRTPRSSSARKFEAERRSIFTRKRLRRSPRAEPRPEPTDASASG